MCRSKTSAKSVRHNTQLLRLHLEKLANDQVMMGSLEERRAAAEGIAFQKPVSGVTLWLDSSDFLPQRQADVRSKKGIWWSHKLNRPGIRIWTLCDGEKRVLYMSSAGSPKFYDGDWVRTNGRIFTSIPDNVIIADCHFNVGKKASWFPALIWSYPQASCSQENNGTRVCCSDR